MLTLTEFTILAFAAARATRFVTADSLLDRPRERLNNWFADKPTSSWRTFWVTLLSCLFCVGFWLSAATVAVYLAASGRWHDAPVLVHLVEVWAVAGGQAWANYWLVTRDTYAPKSHWRERWTARLSRLLDVIRARARRAGA